MKGKKKTLQLPVPRHPEDFHLDVMSHPLAQPEVEELQGMVEQKEQRHKLNQKRASSPSSESQRC